MTRRIVVELPVDLIRQLDNLAGRSESTRSRVLRGLVEAHLETQRCRDLADELRAENDRRDLEGYTRFPQLSSLREEELRYGTEAWG